MIERIGILTLALLLAACGGNPDSGRYREKPAPAVTISINTCQGNQVSARLVSIPGYPFQQGVADFVSNIFDPNALGQISGDPQGPYPVILNLNLAFDENKQIVSHQSTMNLEIRDSLVGQAGTDGNAIESVEVVHNSNSQLSGSWNPQTQELKVQFHDELGDIWIEARLQNANLSGIVRFKNSSSWDGSRGREGVLGQFFAQGQSCGF